MRRMPNRIAAIEIIDQANRIQAWQDAQTALINAAGLPEASFVDTANIANSTFVSFQDGFKQTGKLIQAKVKLGSTAWAGYTMHIKVVRWNSGTSLYDIVAEQDIAVTGDAKAVVTLTFNPQLDVQIGDLVGIYTAGYGSRSAAFTGYSVGNASGDITTSDAFATVAGTRRMNIDCLMYPPYLAITGDSIPEGHCGATGGATDNHGALDFTYWDNAIIKTIPWYVPGVELGAQLRALIGSGSMLKYQNLAKGSQTWAWVASTGAPACHAVKPHTILIMCGVNDVSAGRTWAQVEANLNTIKAGLTTERLLISEQMPWNAGSDVQAATIRTWNANYAAWCITNGAVLVKCHDEMAQVRASTGLLDDMKAAYNHDDTHPNAAGVAYWASLIAQYL